MLIDEDEARLTNPSTPLQVKCITTKPLSVPALDDTMRTVVCDLLNSLVVKNNEPLQDS